ncbi:MAG: methylated-DNA--[protein]-cysteine S-methyltransferase [Halodesulfurarchaeum sp.]
MEVRVFGTGLYIDESLIDASPGTIRRQLSEYEVGDRSDFDLVVDWPATFTGQVMAAVSSIPYGSVKTYGDVASAVGTAPVAVGGAVGRNPVPIIGPCHRVVGVDGIGGYSASGGKRYKALLLEHEGVAVEERFGPSIGGRPRVPKRRYR